MGFLCPRTNNDDIIECLPFIIAIMVENRDPIHN